MHVLPSGQWCARNWRNVPGPLYATHGAFVPSRGLSLPAPFARDRRGLVYLWRQPRDSAELVDVLSQCGWWGLSNEEIGVDGDEHWTLDAIRTWWSLRDEVGAAYRESGIGELAQYMERDLPAYLRSYAFFLAEGRRPTTADVLPEIDVPHVVRIAPPTGTFASAVELFARRRELVEARGLGYHELPFWGERELQWAAMPRDVPGLFAVSATAEAARDVGEDVCDGPAGPFVFRQPSSPKDLERMLEAAVARPLALRLRLYVPSVSGIRQWWRDHQQVVRAATSDAYVDGELTEYLRALMFLVENGHLPGPHDALPGFVFKRPLPGLTSMVLCAPSELPVAVDQSSFGGQFEEKNRLNVPGMFYGADTDTCGTGPGEAPENVALDTDGQEFVFCQPFTKRELLEVLRAAEVECFSGYGCDGNAHWTVELVRSWWADRNSHREAWRAAEISDVDERFESDVPQWLRTYMFYLQNRRAPRTSDELPEL